MSFASQLHAKPLAARLLSSTFQIPRSALTRLVPPIAFVSLIVLWIAAYIERSLKLTVSFAGFEGDGPFQTFNPLRRIAAGQSGGVDFQYFHGIGFPYLHYPIFALAGGDVFATELSRHLVNLAVFFGSTLAISAALGKRWLPTLGLTAFALLIAEQAPLYYLTTVGNASSGVRSAAPFFAVAVLLAGLRPRREALAVGTVTGIGLLTGVEHGLAIVPMLIVVWIGRRIIGHPAGTFSWALTAAAAMILSAGSLLLLIGGPTGAVAALKYSLVEVPADQFWYFGAPPNTFLFQWSVLVSDRRLLAVAVVPLLLLAAITVHVARRHPDERPTAVVLFGLMAYGFVSLAAYLGYTSGHYLEPATRAAVTVGLVLIWRVWSICEEGSSARRTMRLLLATFCGAALLAGPTFLTPCSVFQIPETARSIAGLAADVKQGRCKMSDDAQGELEAMVAAIDADRAKNGVTQPPVIWSTYAGRLEAHYGVFNPACDYTIHALGPNRRPEYTEVFREKQPDYVVTCREPQYPYEQWLRNTSWDFYEEILLNYRPMMSKKRFVIWHRNGQPWRSPDPTAVRISVEPEAPDWFTVPALTGVSAEAPRIVEVEYRIENRLAGVPVVGGLPRYLLGPVHCANTYPVSLPPYRTSWSFPVFPNAGETPLFGAKAFSLVGGKVTILRVHVRPMPATPEQLDALLK